VTKKEVERSKEHLRVVCLSYDKFIKDGSIESANHVILSRDEFFDFIINSLDDDPQKEG
jgi:hypothetical protein